MLLLAICILGLGFGLCWFLIPDPDGGREDDDLPALGDSIDRAIALAAALPPEVLLDSKEKVMAMGERYLTKRTTPSHVTEVWGDMAEIEYTPEVKA